MLATQAAIRASEYGTLEQFYLHLEETLGVTLEEIREFTTMGVVCQPCPCGCGRWMLTMEDRRCANYRTP